MTFLVLSKIKALHFWYIFVQNNHVWTAAKSYEKTYYTFTCSLIHLEVVLDSAEQYKLNLYSLYKYSTY